MNALDALVLAYNAVSALRQQLRPDEKVASIITDGGKAENIIPDRAAGRWKIRARTTAQLETLKARVLACFEGAALQTGCTLEHTWIAGCRDVRANRALAAAYRRNGEALGRTFVAPERVPVHVAGSTDMGDVSYAVLSIHPALGAFAPDVPGHSEELAGCCRRRGRGPRRGGRSEDAGDDGDRRVDVTGPPYRHP